MKLCVFDFDSTLMDGETIDFFAESLGLKDKVAEITERAMQGNMDFFESLIERVALLEGLEFSKVEEICNSLPFMPGAKETIAAIKRLHEKNLVTRDDGGYLTDLGIETAEHVQKALSILTSK